METVSPQDVLNINVGILGHVDSGKTSLVKALSTLLSTAALDKSKQSRQRGMTLDLGFSCFFLDMPEHLKKLYPDKSKLQITLVDCPGHASLIRTIIGGAQIIDIVLLVVDSVKGWQAQTTECLVLAELTSPHLVVALNKADQFPVEERESKLRQAAGKVRSRLQGRFADAPIVGVAACVGGEKVAATDHASGIANETYNMDELVKILHERLPPPKRTTSAKGSFYFSVDHCFPIRGRGTVLTGTCLSGSANVNDVIEFPKLGIDRKIKSMQMFKRQVDGIQQGDRAGICVSNLDAKALERGIAATPGAVMLLKGAIALVRRVPHYVGSITGGSKFHISVGHTTIMATATFWGAKELLEMQKNNGKLASGAQTSTSTTTSKKNSKELVGNMALGGEADMAGLPSIPFDFDQDFLQQDKLLESLEGQENLLHWALLDFQVPVYCPMESLVIGSRLDTVDIGGASGSVSSCRLAFSGRLLRKVDPQLEASNVRLYTPKERRGTVSRLGDAHKRTDDGAIVRYEVYGGDMFKKETNIKAFLGMKVETSDGDVGEIKSAFGTSGKFRVLFSGGTQAKEGDELIMRFKRYAHDPAKAMHQKDIILPPSRPGARIETEKKKVKLPEGIKRFGEVVSLKGDAIEGGKHSLAIIGGFFAPQVNIRERAGVKVKIISTNEEGTILGPFGKAGKCKVSFEPHGISAEPGAKAELLL